jgi:hypothetical protein
MDTATQTRLHAAGRVAIGTAMVLVPQKVAATWIGEREAARTGAQVLTQALGIRDAAIGVGILATQGTSAARTWLLAAVAADSVDLAATLRGRDDLPAAAVAGVGAIASGSALFGLYLATRQ